MISLRPVYMGVSVFNSRGDTVCPTSPTAFLDLGSSCNISNDIDAALQAEASKAIQLIVSTLCQKWVEWTNRCAESEYRPVARRGDIEWRFPLLWNYEEVVVHLY